MNSSTSRPQTLTTNTSPHPNSNMQLLAPPTHHPQDHNNNNHEDTYQPIKVYMYDDDNDNRDSEVFDMLAEHLDQVDWDNLCDLMEDDSEQQEDVFDIMPLLQEVERVTSPPTLLWSVQEEGEESQQQGGSGCNNLPAPPSPIPLGKDSIAAVTVSASSMEDSSATLVSTDDSAQPVASMISNSSSTTASSLSPTEKKSKKSKKQPTDSIKQLVRKSQVDCRHILSGRRYSTNQHCGNIEFRKIIQQHLERYQQSSKRNERAAIGKDIYTALTQQHQLIFVQCNDQTGWCRPLSQKEARQKIGHALRDAAASRERKFITEFTTVLKCSEQELFAPLPLE